MRIKRYIAVLAAVCLALHMGLPALGAGLSSQRAVDYLRDHPAGPLHVVVAQVAGFKPKGSAVTDMGILVRDTKGRFDSPIRHSQVLMAEIASGNDPQAVDGVDLVRTLLDADLERELADKVWALLALRSAPLPLPDDGRYTLQGLTQAVTVAQREEGYLPYPYGEGPDLITTALAVCALAQEPEAAEFVQRALDWLQSTQNQDGSFSEYNPTASAAGSSFASGRATAAAMLALRAGGRGEAAGAAQALAGFQTSEGGFSQQWGGKADAQTTELAVLALCEQQNPFDLSAFYLADQKPDALQTLGIFAVKSVGILALIYIVLVLVHRYGNKNYAKNHPGEPSPEGELPGEEGQE